MERIVIRARSLYIYKLMDTKTLHQSYTVLKQIKKGDLEASVSPSSRLYGIETLRRL